MPSMLITGFKMDDIKKMNKVIKILDEAANYLECLGLEHLSEHIDSVSCEVMAELTMKIRTVPVEVYRK